MNMDSIGFLQLAVKTAKGALPIADANISIYEYSQNNEGGGKGNLIYSLSTDENGNTTKVALKTKSKELSTVPGNESPFSVYNIYVSKDGFYDASYINTPIFDGVTSIQPISLIPLLEYAHSSDDLPLSEYRNSQTPNTEL